MGVRLGYFYNVDAQSFCDSDGTPLAIEQLPRVTLSQQGVLALTCVHDNGSAAVFGADDVFAWSADDDWDAESEPLMLTGDAGINVVADWPDVEPAAGRVCVRVDGDTAALQEALGAAEEITVYGELQVFASGASQPYYVGQMEFRARNLVNHGAVTAPASGGTHYAMGQVDALLAAKLDLAGGTLSGDVDCDGAAKLLKVLGLSLEAASEVTVSGGAIVPTGPIHAVDTEGDAATDELATISDWTGLLFLYLADVGRVVTLTHGTGAGAISTADGEALAMTAYGLVLLYRESTGDAWRVLAGGGGSAVAEDLDIGSLAVEAGPTSGDQLVIERGGVRKRVDWDELPAGGGPGGGGAVSLSDNLLVNEVLGADGQELGASGLGMTSGRSYRVAGSILLANTSSITWRFNGDTSGSHYDGACMAQSGTTLGDADDTTNVLAAYLSTDGAYTLEGLLTVDAEGYATLDYRLHSMGTGTRLLHVGQIRKTDATVTEITAVAVHSASGTGLAAGSWLRVWEERDVQVVGNAALISSGVAEVDQFTQFLRLAYLFDNDDAVDRVSGTALVEANSPTYVAGKFGRAIQFASAGSAYAEGYVPQRQMGNLLFCAWVQVVTGSRNNAILGMTNQASNTYGYGLYLRVTSANKVEVSVVDASSAVTVTGTTALSTGTWYHVAVWCDGEDELHVYLNGSEEGTAASIDTAIAGMSRLVLGAWSDTGSLRDFLDGRIDQALLFVDIPYHTVSDVTGLIGALYNSGSGVDVR